MVDVDAFYTGPRLVVFVRVCREIWDIGYGGADGEI